MRGWPGLVGINDVDGTSPSNVKTVKTDQNTHEPCLLSAYISPPTHMSREE